ncbi:unnamed protein product [Phytophthora fragariaefolia]|uniref:Unnamed protein product n=1 Tax=Phytophthora fragariaefolia TaxID=1490495 RepID=A0A9W6Y9X3_9STRA|nr:unnamed protein product [Phytophthora fragariaefolia]
MKGLRDGPVKTYLFREYPGPPAGDAVERVDIGHAVSKTAAPSESHAHCKKQDGKLNLVILKISSKREWCLRALVDCGASNNFGRLQSLARLDFEEVELPRSLLEVRLATGVVVRTEKRVVRVRFSYREKKFVDELIVLDLDDKLDMMLGMPWLARQDPVIDWAKRMIVRFRSSGATESDGPVGATHAPRGVCDPPPADVAQGAAAPNLSARTLTTERVVREKGEPNQKTHIRSGLRGSRSFKSDAVASTSVDTQVEQGEPVTKDSDMAASTPGVDGIGPNVKRRCAGRRRGNRGASAPGADATNPEYLDTYEYWYPVSEDDAGESSDARAGVGITSSHELEALRPRSARWTHRPICILLRSERMECEMEDLKQLVTEGADALGANSKKERFDQ